MIVSNPRSALEIAQDWVESAGREAIAKGVDVDVGIITRLARELAITTMKVGELEKRLDREIASRSECQSMKKS